MNGRRTIEICGILGLLGMGLPSLAGSYTLDLNSPSVFGTGDIMVDTGGVPTVGLNLSTLGLQVGDIIDAISDGNDPIWVPTYGPHDHLFSVQRQSLGAIGSAVEGERLLDTFPGASPGHLSDVFEWSHSAIGANVLAPVGRGWNGGDGDEANAGLVNTGLQDNVSALESAVLSHGGGTPLPFEVYFSLGPGSPTLASLGAGMADILAVGGCFGPTPVVFATAASLGIPPGVMTDIDAMSLHVEPGLVCPKIKMLQFSVSSALAAGWSYGISPITSGADILVYDAVTPAAFVGHRPADLGLRVSDDVDGFESFIPPTPPLICPADSDDDGIVGIQDFLRVLQDWGACPDE